jgi:histidinol dehydrogenase
MPARLTTADPDFERLFAAVLESKREAAADVGDGVARIIADVRARGDAALVDYAARFDRIALTARTLAVTPEEVAAAAATVDVETRAALSSAAQRIEDFHRRQRPVDDRYTDADGVELGLRWTPLASVGVYVPGGLAAYPSTVLMTVVPARVAGVERVVMTVPTPDGKLNGLVMCAAEMCGVTEIYRIGGAQAIAALAFGTATVRPVDKIVGPGNAYVAAAKRQVYGTVGIDTIAGPSEILVVADRDNDPDWIAADLLSQAEHDASAQAILLTDDPAFADDVERAVERTLTRLERRSIAAESWRSFGTIIQVASFDEAPSLIDRIAPEHLEIATADPDGLAARVRNAGAMFLGRHTPEAVGDYVAGPSHVLPTARSARFSSGLGVADFMKRTSVMRCDSASLAAIAPAVVRLADAEGFGAHAHSVRIRLAGASAAASVSRPPRGGTT